jgi:GNAT superfamily N-acetyltransferase
MNLRILQSRDIPEAVKLSFAAGWNQTSEDWQRLLDLAPESCFCIELDNCLAATATLLALNRDLAWLGMVLTHGDYRHRGLAHRLVEKVLETADRLRIGCVGLDATDQGQSIYEAAGFISGPNIERWTASSIAATTVRPDPLRADWLDRLAGLDRQAFGADRNLLLRALAGNCENASATEDGYVLTRPGRRANYLGPCVARTPEVARNLIVRCLSKHSGPWIWDLFPSNTTTLEIARDLGFEPARRLVRMYRGQPPPCDLSLVHAAAGFELG